jgi:transcription initiation factor TFIIIB Brf1 subunit/transcription initiation factor TFIIB
MNCPECGGKIYYDWKFYEHVCEVCGLVVATNRKLLYIKKIVRGRYDLSFTRYF